MSRKYNESTKPCRCRDCRNYSLGECAEFCFPVSFPDKWRICDKFLSPIDTKAADMVKSRHPKGK